MTTDDQGGQVLRRKFVAPLENTEGRILEGCCVPYGEAEEVRDPPDVPPFYGRPYFELFEPGAFSKQLRAADKIELRYEHRDGLADSVGVCRALHEEAHGLFGTFVVHAGAFGDQALELVRAGVLPGFSIEFADRYRQWKRTARGVVTRRSCQLFHVGLVRKPAHTGALVTAMRSRAELAADLDLELPEIADEQVERLRAVGITV